MPFPSSPSDGQSYKNYRYNEASNTWELVDYSTTGHRLIIYYGVPIGINSTWSVELAAQEFSYWDYIVLGAGLEDSGNAEHTNTQNIINELKRIKPSVKIFGYASCGITTSNYTESTIQNIVDNWMAMGVNGVFYDEMGYDYDVSRSRQNNLIDYAHSVDAELILNSWRPDDLFSSDVETTFNPSGVATTAEVGDMYLSESFIVNTSSFSSNGGYVTQYNFKNKEDKIVEYSKTLGIVPLACDVVESTVSDVDREAYWQVSQAFSLIFGKRAYGIQMYNYSASGDGQNIAYKDKFVRKDFFKDFYTTNVNYVIDGSWVNFERSQSGKIVQGSITDSTGPWTGTIIDDLGI